MEKYQKLFNDHVRSLQEKITNEMMAADSALQLKEDLWHRKDYKGQQGGGGRTRAFTGKIFENAGVNISQIYGAIDPKFASQLKGNGDQLWACGISLIIHSFNPRVPTVHANFRMIVHGDVYWFGGGADLTPFYPNKEDFKYFHHVWKEACQPYDSYSWMKKECDNYFVNHHREAEMRGIGGIFFDHYSTDSLENDFNMVVDLSNSFIRSFFPIVAKRKEEQYSEADEEFMLYRRGRYVEFNLIHDRGTLFGLKTNGRTDSILISLPARCKFAYQWQPAKGSIYDEMMRYYRPYDW